LLPWSIIAVDVTVLDVIKRSTEYLEGKGVESPRLQIELLLAHVLKVPRLKLYLDFERRLSEGDLETLRAMVKRRGEREPLQYIVGTTSFCGLEISVTPAVLIPRPETELLVEQTWKFLSSRGGQAAAVLDFGTGSGCIAIAIAHKFPACEVHAIDACEEALQVARTNAERVRAKVHFNRGAAIDDLTSPRTFDLVVSNPPYNPDAEVDTLQPEVRDYEPRLALGGGREGLDFYHMIASHARARLAASGRVIVELGHGQEGAVRAIFEGEGWFVESVIADYAGTPRILIARQAK
jgi:release factor glutamine methyltransferase